VSDYDSSLVPTLRRGNAILRRSGVGEAPPRIDG
jgi:hypothetical protein